MTTCMNAMPENLCNTNHCVLVLLFSLFFICVLDFGIFMGHSLQFSMIHRSLSQIVEFAPYCKVASFPWNYC